MGNEGRCKTGKAGVRKSRLVALFIFFPIWRSYWLQINYTHRVVCISLESLKTQLSISSDIVTVMRKKIIALYKRPNKWNIVKSSRNSGWSMLKIFICPVEIPGKCAISIQLLIPKFDIYTSFFLPCVGPCGFYCKRICVKGMPPFLN